MTSKPPSQVIRIAIGAEEPLKTELTALIASQEDMVCVAAHDQATRLEKSISGDSPELLVVDLSWCDAALRFIERVMSSNPRPILALDTEVRTQPAVARAEQARKLGVVAVIPPPPKKKLAKNEPLRRWIVHELRQAVGATAVAPSVRLGA